MLPALAGMAVKALLPSGKKVDKNKLLNRKESSAIQKVDSDQGVVKAPTIQKKTISTNLLLPQPEIKALPPAAEVKRDVKSGRLDDIFDRVGETLQGIIDALKNKDQAQKEEQKTKKEEAKVEEKKEREEKLEKEAKKKPVKKPNIKLPKDRFNLMRFFGNVLLGSLALAIFKNLEEIIETLKNVFQTIKDFITKVGEFFSPVWNGLKWIVRTGMELVGKIKKFFNIGGKTEDEEYAEKAEKELEKSDNIWKEISKFFGIDSDSEDSPTIERDTSTSTPGSLGSAPPGTVLSTGAKTTYYDPSLGGINASGYKTPEGLPATSTGEGYRANVFSAAAFPPLLAKLPSSMTTPAAKFPGGRTLKRPFNVIVTNSQGKKAVVRVNDVGPGVAGHSSNHMLDLSVAAKNYLGTGGGFTIEMASSDATPGPLTGISPQQQKADEIAGQAAAATQTPTPTTQGPTPTSTPAPSGTPGTTPAAPSGTPGTTPEAPSGTPGTTPAAPSGTPGTPGTTPAAPSGTPGTTPAAPSGTPGTPSEISSSLLPQAQVSQMQSPSAVSASIPQIMQQAEYEIPGGSQSTVIPIPIGSGSAPMIMGGGGTRLLPIGVSKQALLNSYYQSQLLGFLYKQG